MYCKLIDGCAKAGFFVAVVGILNFSSGAFSSEPISSRRDLEGALENAVKCMPDALEDFDGIRFDGGPDDLRKTFEKLEVRVASESKHGGGVTYQFPRGIRIFGYEAGEALYFDESTTLFFVRLQSGPEALRSISEALRLTPIRKGNPDGYGYFGEFDVRYFRKLPDGLDSPPNAIFSGIGYRNGRTYVVIGCQNLAW